MSTDTPVRQPGAQAEYTVRGDWFLVPMYFEAMARRMLDCARVADARKPAKAKGRKKR